MAAKGKFHATHCPRQSNPEAVCRCIAGTQGLARRSEGMAYHGGDSTRAITRRRRQLERQAAKGRDW